jgi:uncharacterized integral membrane protein
VIVTAIRNLFYVLLGAVLAIFIYFNFDQRVVVYLTRGWHTREIPLALALFGAMLAGFLVATILAAADQVRLRSRLRTMRRSVERLESELSGLRKLPLEESLPAPRSREEPDPKTEKRDS